MTNNSLIEKLRALPDVKPLQPRDNARYHTDHVNSVWRKHINEIINARTDHAGDDKDAPNIAPIANQQPGELAEENKRLKQFIFNIFVQCLNDFGDPYMGDDDKSHVETMKHCLDTVATFANQVPDWDSWDFSEEAWSKGFNKGYEKGCAETGAACTKGAIAATTKRESSGWNIDPKNIDAENEWQDGFNGEHYTYDTGKKTMFILGLDPEEYDAVKKLLTEGNNIPMSPTNEIESDDAHSDNTKQSREALKTAITQIEDQQTVTWNALSTTKPVESDDINLAFQNAVEILANFKSEGNRTKLEEMEAAYAMLFTQMVPIMEENKRLKEAVLEAKEKNINLSECKDTAK